MSMIQPEIGRNSTADVALISDFDVQGPEDGDKR
jgi:hypothetical protein